MPDNYLRYTLRVNRELFQKFRYVAEYEGRSANKEIEQFLKRHIAEFEQTHGPIDISEK
ncbi:MAG: Arc family DNA-binding protein [Clostridia bacterium]|nr:Arc family DNA-binding protein [Clostridia bacterium]MBQ4612826.1 Arc family DNA-binding protein [Clostridia bacterium]